MRSRALFTALAGAALLPALATPALAHGYDKGKAPEHYVANLQPVPHAPEADGGSEVSGHAHLVKVNGKLKVEVHAHGLSPDLAHLMHIHGEAKAKNECPGEDFRKGGVNNGLIETVDGLPAYGPIQVTFSTKGDTSADAGLSLDTAPVADHHGELSYKRVIKDVPEELLDELDNLHIVIHGEDLDDDGAYDGEPITALGAPLEAELPVACGEIDEKKDRKHGHANGHAHKHGHYHG